MPPLPTSLPSPPRAARRPQDVSVHGDRRIDDYFWLRERDNPDVRAHLQAENDYARAWFAPHGALQARLYDEALSRLQENDEDVPYRRGDWWYFKRTLEGQAYPCHMRRRGAPDGPEQVVLDLNALAQDKPFLQAGAISVSPDGELLAYTLDESGSLDFTLAVKRLSDGELLPLRVEQIARGVAWANDNRTLFVLTHDTTRRTARVWRHDVHERGPGTLVYEDRNGLFWVSLSKTRDQRWIVIGSDSADTSELRVIPADRPTARQRVVLPRRKGREAALDHGDGRFYLLVNDTGPNFRLVSMPAARPAIAEAEELVAHRADVLLEDIDVFARHLVIAERDQGLQKLRVIDRASGESHHLAFEEQVYSAHGLHNAEYDTDSFRFAFVSLTTPQTVYDYDLRTRAMQLRKRQPVLGGYEPTRYESVQLQARAPDGAAVPVSLVWRRDARTGGPQPLLLRGYGAYGMANDVYFSSTLVSLLDRGVIVALGHVRGGTDLGRTWYDQGKLQHKMNSFTDFVACAQALVDGGWTTPAQLIIEGGSAGGLLVGATANLRPDLFRAVVAEVPFVDTLNTMLDDSLPLTVGEYLEWGNPKKKTEYAWIRAYSPYDNLRATAYPAFYLHTSLHDSQVPYWEAAKFAARLRDLKTDEHPVVLSINLEAGHGGSSGRYDALRERAEALAFMLVQWGLASPDPLPG